MKIITWGELLELQGDIVWSYYSGDEFPTAVMINFGYEDRPVQRLCEEMFPITTPELGELSYGNYQDQLESFEKIGYATVTDLDTSGDVIGSVDDDRKVIIYDQKDIDSWKAKLESLVIKY